jgi:hypothetical protein
MNSLFLLFECVCFIIDSVCTISYHIIFIMRFAWAGGLEPPEWVLSEISLIARIVSNN